MFGQPRFIHKNNPPHESISQKTLKYTSGAPLALIEAQIQLKIVPTQLLLWMVAILLLVPVSKIYLTLPKGPLINFLWTRQTSERAQKQFRILPTQWHFP